MYRISQRNIRDGNSGKRFSENTCTEGKSSFQGHNEYCQRTESQIQTAYDFFPLGEFSHFLNPAL